MTYIENPKTKGSGIVCCIPQTGECPNKCPDCFFQSGRSYLEPLDENLPNIPTDVMGRIVRVNDGNDSNVNRELVMQTTIPFEKWFFNTAIPKDIEGFVAPVVLTVNPADMTDQGFYKLDPIPKNLMAVRIRVNTWNLFTVTHPAVKYYSDNEIPIFLTFMAYYNEEATIPEDHKHRYIFKKRTLNSYWVIMTSHWEMVMGMFAKNKWVYSCSKREGEEGVRQCHRCGNCLREYFYCLEKLRNL